MDKFCFQNLNANRPLLTVAGNYCWLFVHYVSYFPHCCDKSSLNKGLLSLTAWREQVGVARMAWWQEPEAAGLLVFTVRTQREWKQSWAQFASSYPVQDPSPWTVLSACRAGLHTPVQTRGLPQEVLDPAALTALAITAGFTFCNRWMVTSGKQFRSGESVGQ